MDMAVSASNGLTGFRRPTEGQLGSLFSSVSGTSLHCLVSSCPRNVPNKGFVPCSAVVQSAVARTQKEGK